MKTWARLFDLREELRRSRSDLLDAINCYLDEPNADTKERMMEALYWYEYCHKEFNKLFDRLEQELKKTSKGESRDET